MSVLILHSSPSSLDAKDQEMHPPPLRSLHKHFFPSFFPWILQKETEQVEVAHPQGPKAGS